jgi:hypothetical protein
MDYNSFIFIHALSLHWPEDTDESNKNIVKNSPSLRRFEPETSRTRMRYATHSTATFDDAGSSLHISVSAAFYKIV